MSKCILGIDTSNYRTSVALVDLDNNILVNNRKLLEVRKGERGMQQSAALFSHLKNLPDLIPNGYEVVAVSCSNRPRPLEGSYMPVFVAGETVARSIANILDVPMYTFSHQEGHIEAGKIGTPLEDNFIAFHLSGGTTEALLCKDGKVEIVGGTKDISFGQLIDRIGVKLGYMFPAGEALDGLLREEIPVVDTFTHVKVKDGYFNLSGLETQLFKLEGNQVVKLAFDEIVRVINLMMKQLKEKYEVEDFLLCGGVASSTYIKDRIDNAYFAKKELSGDNAVGIALLGGKEYGKKASNHITTK
ncbi:MAG: O-sialoglycoprotein endopeptidase [Clostridia bacterium]|nr:O-sialoglycoprotein endopeptidase [Clostridia bacterium]